MKGIPIKINRGTPQERMIGLLFPKLKLFVKTVYESRHLFRVLDAWGIDAKYFSDVLLPNNYKIRVVDKETGKIYTIQAETIKKKGEFYHFKREQEDDHAQIFCARRHWEVQKPKSELEQLEEDAKRGVYG